MAEKTNDQIIRALYLKGIMAGNEAIIELTAPIYVKNEEEVNVKVAKPGDRYPATMQNDGWHVRMNDHLKRSTINVTIPLADGKVR